MFPKISELPPPLYSLEGVDVGYGDKKVLENISLRLDNDDRVALIGANGNGKSTFVKLLAGVITEMSGDIIKSSKLRIGYFSQDLTDELDSSISPIDSITKKYSKEPIEAIRRHLGAFGFNQDMVFGSIKQLSGGEKARLLFAQIALAKPHILLLDEPTNHLDILSREALIQAINGFPGAVILVSHDPHLLELTVDRFWLVANNEIQNYDGDISDYRSLLLSQNRSVKHNKKLENDKTKLLTTSSYSKKDKRRLAAEQRKSLTVLRKAASDAENELIRLSEEK
jgi:ATP-binding cassette subfamily F protein 3